MPSSAARSRRSRRPMRRPTRRSPRAADAERRIDARAARLVEAIRARAGGLGGVEDFLREYSLSTKEGLALMVLAEALLRVPDAATADRLIEDKLAAADWSHHDVQSTAFLVSASAWALGVGARIIHPGETPEHILTSLAKRLGLPALRAATRQAMRLLGSHFVLGETIEQALARAAAHGEFRYSFDMLGEAARTAADAERYFGAYATAIDAIGAPAVIDWVIAAAQALDRRLNVRLVKGAYWDSEIKRAQERGLADYPVFTRKAMTDLCYMDCMRRLIAARPQVFPQFATHNALTVASVIEEAGGVEGYEFQRLHGMGEALYETLLAEETGAACRVYAPVGSHRDLLAYLVRRLLENGANSSFVSVAADPRVPIETILQRPQSRIADAGAARHPHIPLPADLYAPVRRNSRGIELGDRAAVRALLAEITAQAPKDPTAQPLVDGVALRGRSRAVTSPIEGAAIGIVVEGDEAIAIAAMAAAAAGFPAWAATPRESRAAVLEQAADALEARRARLIALLQREAGKTLEDAIAEVREAADFCRYYACELRRALKPGPMPGPTGESNELTYRGRGAFVCISPWNFPLAIFLGQISAALAAGNSVIAKPAEQTPLVAAEAVRLMHAAGVPPSALHLVPGNGRVGALLVEDPRTAGVAFTGSNETAAKISRALAAKSGPLVPLIAETGGINAMVVDATALPEQVTDDVLTSAFRSAGQRCSALRLLCVQEDVADAVLAMIEGAVFELEVGDPCELSTHIGPVIDAEAKTGLEQWIARMHGQGRVRFRWDRLPLPTAGTYVAPTIVELDRASDLREEVFGPVLHVVRWRADELDSLLEDIAASGYGLTLGIHSRIELTVARIVARLAVGKVYVNRNMIGAVVGTQPFGGSGLSGTGPKAGGPNYLRRFAHEQVVSVNTAAVGGNATLLAEPE